MTQTKTKTKTRPPQAFVQVERSALLPWEQLIATDSTAARMMMIFLHRMNKRNAIVISQATLSKILGVGVRTVQRSMRTLKENHWVQLVKVGNVSVIVINHAVAWQDSRELKGRFSTFDAVVVADASEQENETLLMDGPLHRVPYVVPPETALIEEGESGMAQQTLPGFHPIPELPEDVD